ncbi:MAG TPA: aromatic ring-hydroxylating dioxygenase subunit alpha [Candidatus Acidoferrum sp.]|nr:aromatic ring-hydroxylating dioxygenase subunit alpha [Candidatus Acidoferrum sp.]
MTTTNKTSGSVLEKSLPTSYYLSAEIFAREKERIFCREWFCAGREEQLRNPGDYVVLDVLGESILVVRTKAGELKAHYNVCRHRGTRLCAAAGEEEAGGVQLNGGVLGPNGIRCPYHHWTYALDGQLLNAPHLREGDGFCKADFSLYPVGIETWGGFFFLNLTPEASAKEDKTLLRQMGEAAERVKRYALRELRVARRLEYVVEGNWKAIVENYNECYHCGGLHPELCEVVPAFKQQGGGQLDWERGIPHREGAFTFTFSGATNRKPFPGLNEDEKIRHKGELIYPNFMLSLAAEHAAAFTLWPQGPTRTRVICEFLFHPDEMAKPEFDPSDVVDFWDLINRQDWAICKRVQQGISTRVHKFGYYAPMEDMSLDIRRYVNERLGPQG